MCSTCTYGFPYSVPPCADLPVCLSSLLPLSPCVFLSVYTHTHTHAAIFMSILNHLFRLGLTVHHTFMSHSTVCPIVSAVLAAAFSSHFPAHFPVHFPSHFPAHWLQPLVQCTSISLYTVSPCLLVSISGYLPRGCRFIFSFIFLSQARLSSDLPHTPSQQGTRTYSINHTLRQTQSTILCHTQSYHTLSLIFPHSSSLSLTLTHSCSMCPLQQSCYFHPVTSSLDCFPSF